MVTKTKILIFLLTISLYSDGIDSLIYSLSRLDVLISRNNHKKISSKIFKKGDLIRLEPLTYCSGDGLVVYVLGNDTVIVSKLLTTGTEDNIPKFNQLIQLNNVNIKNIGNVKDYLEEFFNFKELIFIKDQNQYTKIIDKYYELSKNSESCSADSLDNDSLLHIINTFNKNTYFTDSLIRLECLVFRKFYRLADYKFPIDFPRFNERHFFIFFRYNILLGKNGTIQEIDRQFLGCLSNLKR